MKKNIYIILLTMICICGYCGFTMHTQAAEIEPLIVGVGEIYNTLNDAMDVAQDGQVIRIIGNVTETNPAIPVVINKRVIIQGDESSVYTVTNWTKPSSPFQIAAEGVVIEDLNIVINGGATIYSLITTGENLSIKNSSITLSGTSLAASAPIFVDASGLTMENIIITSTIKASKILDLQGHSANLKNVSIAAGIDNIGIFSAISPASLVLDGCTFIAAAATAKAVSLPSPDGLTLTGCNFSLALGAGSLGLVFTNPSIATVSQTLIASDCTFDINAAGTGISLNGYNGLFTDCTFNFDISSGKGIVSETASDANLTFTNCEFYVGKTPDKKITGVKCVFLKDNIGEIKIDNCKVMAADPSSTLQLQTAVIIDVSESELNNLTITESDFTFNAKSNGTIGVNAKAINNLIINDSNFIVDAATVKCIDAANVGTGYISKSNFTVGTTATGVVCINIPAAENLTIDDNSNFTINVTSPNARSNGIAASAKTLTIKDSIFNVDALYSKGIIVSGVETGNIINCKIYIKKAGAIGLEITNSADFNFTDNTFDISAAGRGIVMTTSSGDNVGDVVIDNNIIIIKGDATIIGLLFEHLNSLKIGNSEIQTPSGTTGSISCIKVNHIKTVEIDNVDMFFNSTTANGILINETPPPLGDEVRVTISDTNVNLKEKSSRAIRIFYADGVLVDNLIGKVEAFAVNSTLLSFTFSKNVEVKNCNYDAKAAGAVMLSFSSENATSEKSSNFLIHHNTLTIENNAQGIIAGYANHNVEIYENIININNATKGISIAYGRSNNVYNNDFIANNCGTAIVSDGVDEISSFYLNGDKDIYDVNSNIIDEYRNKIYNNKFLGNYERGIYVSNNGDIVSGNDFSGATFNYESTPGEIINTQIIVALCKDVKILDNKFTKARASNKQVIRINNSIISEITDNITQLVDGATEVLFVQGTTSLAPNKVKYPESITAHDVSNTINGITPVEVIHEWNDPDNLVYEYILRTQPSEPPVTTKPTEPPELPDTTTAPEETTTPEPTTTSEPIPTTEAPTEPYIDIELPTIPEALPEPITESPTIPVTQPPSTSVPAPTMPESTTMAEVPTTNEPPTEPYIDIEPPTIPEALPEPITEVPPIPVTEQPTTSVPAPTIAITVGDTDVMIFEEIPDNAIPLSNGWFAVELDDNIWEIFDENKVPLGVVIFDDDDWDWEMYDFENMIPLANLVLADKPATVRDIQETEASTSTESVTEASRPNPPTGNSLYTVFILLLLSFTGVVIFRKKFTISP